MSKYHSTRITVDGEAFDSKKEFRRWQELRMLERAGVIQDLKRQVPFELIPVLREPSVTGPRGGVKRGKLIEKPVNYVADFVYWQDGKKVVEDSKGFHTADYVIKRKLMLYLHGIRILET